MHFLFIRAWLFSRCYFFFKARDTMAQGELWLLRIRVSTEKDYLKYINGVELTVLCSSFSLSLSADEFKTSRITIITQQVGGRFPIFKMAIRIQIKLGDNQAYCRACNRYV